jgi:hypothetical protein
MLAGDGLAAATVAISPVPFRGVRPLPCSTIRAGWPVLGHSANRHRAVALSFEQFQYGFANTLNPSEANELYETYAVPGSGAPVFEVATANLSSSTEVQVDSGNPYRGPMLIVAADQDHTVPASVSIATFKTLSRNAGVTEFFEVHGRGHALTIDHG